jgi:predicted RNase H-like nuclease (RuvC/YqgF family)
MFDKLKKKDDIDPTTPLKEELDKVNLKLNEVNKTNTRLHSELESAENEISELKDKIRKLREAQEEPACTTYLCEQLAEKDKQIRELTIAFKEFSYNMEKRILDINHVVDMTNYEKSEIAKIREENKFLKQLMNDHYEAVQKGEDWRGVFTDDVVKRLGRDDD